MTITIKTTYLTGSQVFDTYDELTAFQHSLPTFKTLIAPFTLFKENSNVLNEYSEQIPGGWVVYRIYPDTALYKTTYKNILGTPENSILLSDVAQVMSLMGWIVTQEEIIS